MQLVYSSQNTLLVDNLKNALEAEEIECIVKNRQLGGASGEVPPIEAWLELWVLNDDQVERAQRMIDEAAEPGPTAPTWRCEKCGEDIPGEMGVCWKCSGDQPKPAAPDPLPGSLLYRAAWRRMTSAQGFSWIAIAAMVAAVILMLTL